MSYTDADKVAIVAAVGNLAQRYCPLCGRTDLPIEGAHMLPKSIGGDGGPTNPLCKCCHEAHDAYEVKFMPIDGGPQWDAIVLSARFAAYLSVRLDYPVTVGHVRPLVFDRGYAA